MQLILSQARMEQFAKRERNREEEVMMRRKKRRMEIVSSKIPKVFSSLILKNDHESSTLKWTETNVDGKRIHSDHHHPCRSFFDDFFNPRWKGGNEKKANDNDWLIISLSSSWSQLIIILPRICVVYTHGNIIHINSQNVWSVWNLSRSMKQHDSFWHRNNFAI